MKPSPRPQNTRTWTQADHDENTRRIQSEADFRLIDKMGRKFGVRGRDFAAALGRMLDDRIAAALRTQETFTLSHFTNPETADALRAAVVDLILDDLTELISVLTSKESKHDTRPKKTR